MKKVLTVAIAVAMMLAMTLALSSCNEQCNGDEIGADANQVSRKEPTCTSQGYIEYECSQGGDNHVVILEALGHKNIKWFTDVLPTCTTDGSEHSECTVCGEQVETKIIPATGHDESDWIIDKAATCVDNGAKHTECANCSEVISQQVIVAPGHSMDETWYVSVPVSCLEDGERYQKCTECDYKVYEVVKAVGHDPKPEYTVRREATCLVEGYEELECTKCDEILAMRGTPTSDHHKIDKIIVPPTCTESGIKQVVCRDCEIVFGVETAPAMNHDMQLVVDVAPDCKTAGIGHVECMNCGLAYDSKPIDALGHNIENGVCVNLGCDVYERNITVVYKSPNLVTLPEGYSAVAYSDEEFVPEIPDKSAQGFYSIVDIDVAENGRDVVYNVIYLRNGVKVVTSVETVVLDVPYGTFYADLKFPISVKGYTDSGEVVYLNASWPQLDENYDPKYNRESQIVTGRVTSRGTTNDYYVTVDEITAVVNVGVNIASVNNTVIGEVPYNTPFSALNLPSTVTAYDNIGDVHELAVRWNMADYKASVAGVQVITGKVVDDRGYVINDLVANATVIVVKNIVSAEDVNFGVVIYGTKFINTGIPSTVKCVAEDGTKIELGVNWNTDAYDPNLLGAQTLTGRIVGIDGYKVSDISVNLNIDIKKAIELVPVASNGYINIGHITKGVAYEDITFTDKNGTHNFLGTYSLIQVVTNSGETRNVEINWDRTSYDPNAYGENTIIGHIVLPDDLWIEDTTIIAKYIAIG